MARTSTVIAAVVYGTLFAIVLGVLGVLASRYSRGLIDDGFVAVRLGFYGGVAVGALLGVWVGVMRSRRE